MIKIMRKRGLKGYLTRIKRKYAPYQSKIGFLAGVYYPPNFDDDNPSFEAENPNHLIKISREGTLPVATVAAMNEYGTSNIPMRPFFRDTIAEKQRGWIVKFKENINAGTYAAIVKLSQESVKDIKQTITDYNSPPNSPKTIAYKGFNDPLIHTGYMRDHVQYKVEKK